MRYGVSSDEIISQLGGSPPAALWLADRPARWRLWRAPAAGPDGHRLRGREEFDFTIAEVAEGRPLASVAGISFKDPNGRVIRNPDRELLAGMDRLPFVTPVYKRDLRPEDYYIGYLLHPYVSLYTGRGCRSRCTFCLWPQTVGGHRHERLWEISAPLLENPPPAEPCEPGSWGPPSVGRLIAPFRWHLPES